MSLPPEFIEFLARITGKRARIVVDHILENGFITTEELETLYGYKHPPRAIRDVREQGVPLETYRIKDSHGRDIAAYRFGDVSKIRPDRIGGRHAFPKSLKDALILESEAHCAVCNRTYEPRYLQIDHRIPYEVQGDSEFVAKNFMLLCPSCNRSKSWSCEHCLNWTDKKDAQICQQCYWANPIVYSHIALQAVRRLELFWSQDEIVQYEQLKQEAEKNGQALSDYIKQKLSDK